MLSTDALPRPELVDSESAWISPRWFEDVSEPGVPRHVNPATLVGSWSDVDLGNETSSSSNVSRPGEEGGSSGAGNDPFDWIVHFSADSLMGIQSVGETVQFLSGGSATFEILRGLGLSGQVLVRSWGSSVAAVQQDLAENPHVDTFELDMAYQMHLAPNDPYYSELWGLNNSGQSGGSPDADIDAAEAWDISTGSRSVVVGVIDSGVDYTHRDLASNIWTNPREIAGNGIDDDGNGFVDDVHGYDFVNHDGDPMDDNGHGTHVAGTIAGAGNDGRGVVGVNWSSQIMGLKFLAADGWGYISDAVQAVNYATMMRTRYGVNIRVTNNSWGSEAYSPAMDNAIRAHQNAGILFVAAAGNSGLNNDYHDTYPANYQLPNVLAVAATDRNDRLAYFSNYGASKVHLAAPGVAIVSTIPENRYAWYYGTSMAAPHVTGVAALAWSVAPEATVAEIRSAILQGVDPLPSLSARVSTGGRLNARSTLELLAAQGANRVAIIDNGDAGYRRDGSWGSGVVGYRSDIDYSPEGDGGNTAHWTFDVDPGQYLVSATWSPHANRASNAPFTISDGTRSLGARQVNQELAPNDFTDRGAAWENLGTYSVDGDTLTVQLSNAANEFVIADAVRIQRVGDLPTGPEIRVRVDGITMSDDSGIVDFGQVFAGAGLTKMFTVENVGYEPLRLGSISLPSRGFSLASDFDSTTLDPGESTSFSVRFDAPASGEFSGTVSFATNDSDENPFNFNIHGSARSVAIVDDGDAGYRQRGEWTRGIHGYQSDIHHRAPGSGNNGAYWTFDVTPGRYRVSTTWSGAPNRATNAPFTIFDGGTSLGVVRVNQELSPDDFAFGETMWEDLGTFDITGHAMSVQLSDAANEYVIADAVRIERIADPPSGPEIQVSVEGINLPDDTGSVSFGQILVGGMMDKTFTVTNTGTELLNLGTIYVPSSGFRLVSDLGSAALSPGQSTSFSVRFDADSPGTFRGTIAIATNDADENPFNFRVQGSATASKVIDNGDTGYQRSGPWSQGIHGYQSDMDFSPAGSGSNMAGWTFPVAPGPYQIAATWSHHLNRASDAPFRVFDGTSLLGLVHVNQELAPNDFSDQGTTWENLGTFHVTGNMLLVRLSNAADDFVIADAVRIVHAGGSLPDSNRQTRVEPVRQVSRGLRTIDARSVVSDAGSWPRALWVSQPSISRESLDASLDGDYGEPARASHSTPTAPSLQRFERPVHVDVPQIERMLDTPMPLGAAIRRSMDHLVSLRADAHDQKAVDAVWRSDGDADEVLAPNGMACILCPDTAVRGRTRT